MDAVHEGRVVPHLGRHRAEQVADPLLVLHVHVEVADHHDAAVGPDALLAAAELAGLHVSLHDVDAVLLVEGDARDLVEADHVVLADQPRWPFAMLTNIRATVALPPRHEVRVGRDLLEQVALARAARPKFDHVVVVLDERHHAQQQHIPRAWAQRCGSKPDAAQQEVLPLGGRELVRGPSMILSSMPRVESWIGRTAFDLERPPPFSWAIVAS